MSSDSSGPNRRLRDLSAAEYSRLSELIDSCLDLSPEARTDWLSRLESDDLRTAEILRRLFATSGAADFDVLLETGELLTRQLSSLAREEESLIGRRVGPYRVLSLLGQGGMGSVWLAERADGLFARQVALKLVHPVLMGRQVTERFAREREILASLSHHHIARLFDAGFTDEGQPYLAMQYVPGRPITAFCDERRLTVRERLELLLQVLSAVQYAHTHLVIHRDLKPSNILVTEEGEVQLLDFGVAKLLSAEDARETELTQLGGRALTPDYAAPEQIAGQPITTATDVYALGVILYELLSGERPYRLKRDSRGALEEAILAADPVLPSHVALSESVAQARGTIPRKLAKALRGDLDTIATKALKKLPAERYATVNAFGEDIARFLRGDVVLAKPDTSWYRVRKFLDRNRLAAGSIAVVVLTLVAGLSVALWQADRAQQQARIAREHARTAEAVQGFMEDLFEANTSDQATPEAARNTTARELLDRGSSKIQAALKDTPAARLRVLKTLSQMYNGLDLDNKATELARERVTLARTLYDRTDPRLAQALVDFSDVANSADLTEEAGKALSEAERILDLAGDSTSITRGKLQGQLAYHYQSVGDWPRSLGYAKQAIQLLRPLGPSYDLAFALFVQAGCSSDAGDARTAKAAALEAVSLVTATHGRINSLAPGIYAQLGYAQTELAEFADAETNLRRAVSASQSITGPETLDTIEMVRTLGDFLGETSRIDEGLKVLAPAHEVALKIAAQGETSVLPAMLLLKEATLLSEYGRFEEAGADLELVRQMRKKLDAAPWLDARAQEAAAQAAIERGKYDTAAKALDEAAATERSLGWDKMKLFNDNVMLRTRLLLAEGLGDEAAKAFVEYRVVNQEPQPTLRAQLEQGLMRSEIDLTRGDPVSAAAQAANLRLQYLAGEGAVYLRSYDARALLVEGKARLLDHQVPQAVAVLQEAVALSRQLYDEVHSPVLADAEIALAGAYLAAGDRKRASQLRAEARAIHATHRDLGEHHRRPLRDLEAVMATHRMH